MTSYERRQTIIDLLRHQPGLKVTKIASTLGVSEGTVRNDLNALEKEKLLTRFHGGAVLMERNSFLQSSFASRHEQHLPKKEAIAKTTAGLVQDGDSIFLDASSTVYFLGLALEAKQRLRVITNGLDVARLLAKNPTHTVILIGGILNTDGSSVTGLFSEEILRDLHFQKAFVSASGLSVDRGLTEVHWDEANLKRKALESAQEIFALIDSSKLGKEDLTSFAGVEQIRCLFTDGGITNEWMERIARTGMAVKICDGKRLGD